MFGFLKKKEKKPEDTPAGDAKKQEKPKEEPVVVNPPKEKNEEPVQKDEAASEDDSSDRNGAYFVSPHPDGGWQVKKAKAKKALKRFDTKAEAEKYAKTVAKNQDSSVVRQKKDGKIQKKH